MGLRPRKKPIPKDAAQVLYETYYTDVLRQVVAVIGDLECAIESTQEAFLRAFEHFDTLRNQTRFSSWVTSIALNVARDSMRKRGRELPCGESLAEAAPKSEHETTEDMACAGEEVRSIREAMMVMPADMRTVTILYYVQDMDIRSISRALGIPEGTVKSRLSRARVWLRDRLNRQDNGTPVKGG